MSSPQLEERAARRLKILEERRTQEKLTHTAAYQTKMHRQERLRKGAFGLVVVAVLGVGIYMAGGVFFGQRGNPTPVAAASAMPGMVMDNASAAPLAGAIPVRLSMAGFDPKVITAKAGATVNLDFWNTDNAMHLDGGGVHTFIMPEYQDIYVKIPPEARQAFSFAAPTTPGDYDFYCDTCCGGKESPTMHGTLRVEA